MRVGQLLPAGVADRERWASDIFAAFATMGIAPSAGNICAVIAITEQESGFKTDPVVPGLPRIAWREIEKRRARSPIPRWALDAALALPSSDGRTFRARINRVRTELQMSRIFDDFIGQVPLGRTFLADRNPVRTGGPMQVSVAFAEMQTAYRPYPYPIRSSVRNEVFSRRGGLYFGIAHLLDYSAPYAKFIYRFADFNAGRYASRNAAFQSALTQASGVELTLDGDLLRYEGDRILDGSASALAAATLARRLGMSRNEILRDLRAEKFAAFEETTLYLRVFALADAGAGHALPRALLPRIQLQSPKLTRKLTTEGFATRVDARHRTCLRRAASYP